MTLNPIADKHVFTGDIRVCEATLYTQTTAPVPGGITGDAKGRLPETAIDNETTTREKQRDRGRRNHWVARKFISRGTVREQFVGATFDRRSKHKRARSISAFVSTTRICVCTYTPPPRLCARVFAISAFLRARNDSLANNDVTVDTQGTISCHRSPHCDAAAAATNFPRPVWC